MKKLTIINISILMVLILLQGEKVLSKDLNKNNNNMIIRISEIEVYPKYLEDYLIYAEEVAKVSVEREKGVVAIYPMSVIKDNAQIRILEIYKNQEAYKNHIESLHFKKYKESTLHMVKSLNLVDMYQICPDNFNKIFKKSK